MQDYPDLAAAATSLLPLHRSQILVQPVEGFADEVSEGWHVTRFEEDVFSVLVGCSEQPEKWQLRRLDGKGEVVPAVAESVVDGEDRRRNERPQLKPRYAVFVRSRSGLVSR